MDLETPPRIRIRIEGGPLDGHSVVCAKPRITMGRKASNDLVLEQDTTISGSHAVVYWEPDGWYLKDSGSTNGTYIYENNEKVAVRVPVRLGQNQPFLLGSSRLWYELAEDAIDEPVSNHDGESSHEGTSGRRVLQPMQHMQVAHRDDELRIRTSSIKPISAEYSIAYNAKDMEKICDSLRDAVLLHNHRNNKSDSIESALQKMGEWLQNQCLPRPVQNDLLETSNGDLLITIDPSLIQIPWELALLKGRPLCMQYNMGRQVVLPYRSRLGGLEPKRKGRRLLIISNPDGTLPEAQQHAEELYYKIVMNYPKVQVELLANNRASKVEILARMQQCDMVYYIGHTEYDAEDREQSSWMLAGGRLTSQDFENLNSPPSLVFANSCESGREHDWRGTHSRAISKKGVAGGFIMAGVTNYIGALWPISAESSTAFANLLFDNVFTGTPIGQSVRLARMGVVDRFGRSNPIWASYVLYGDPTHIHV